MRMLWFVFLAPANRMIAPTLKEAPFVMRLPIVILAIASLWPIVSWHPLAFSGWLLEGIQFPVANNIFITWLSLIVLPILTVVAWLWYRKKEISVNNKLKFSPLLHAFYFDKLFTKMIIEPGLKLSWATEKIDKRVIDRTIHAVTYAQVALAHLIGWVDNVVIDGAVNTTGRLAKLTGAVARSFSAGKIQVYIFWSVFALVIFLFWVLF